MESYNEMNKGINSDPMNKRSNFDPMNEKSNFDPMNEKSNFDPMNERSSFDSMNERSNSDPMNERSSFDPMNEKNTLSDDELRTAETLFFETAESKGADPGEKEAEPSATGYQQHMQNARNAAKRTSSRKKKNARKSLGKKLATTAAIAVVCGLVGGTAFFGANYLGSQAFSATAEQSGSMISASAENAQDTSGNALMSGEKTGTGEFAQSVLTSAAAGEGTVADVATSCLPSVVTIACSSVVEMQNYFGQSQQYEAQSAGSGVIVGMNDTELLIATNDHVISGAKEISVGFIDETSAEAVVKGTSSQNDLAVIAVKLDDLSKETLDSIATAAIGSSDDLVLGEQVVAIGNALGIGTSVTSGYVSAKDRELTFSDGSGTVTQTKLIQTDAPINPGNSGGGLFNMKGELIGINEAKSSTTSSGVTVDGIGYAISIDKALPILEDLMNLKTKEAVPEDQQGYLGVTCANVTSDIASVYDMPEGVCFTSVLEDSPAAKAGAQKGDILKKFDGREIGSFEELKEALACCAAGETVEMTVMRFSEGNYNEVTLSITLGSKDAVLANHQNG